MNIPTSIKNRASALMAPAGRVVDFLLSPELFRWAIRLILIFAILATVYWSLIASDRYVSESNVVLQKTDSINIQALDISRFIAGSDVPSRTDQLMLRDYLLSVDMLKKLDAALDLRSHYSDWHKDIISRMWFKDTPMERFYHYYLSRVTVEYDDFAGVLRIKAQAYDAETAHAIVTMMILEGERHMNWIGHQLAQGQVAFLKDEVKLSGKRFQQAGESLLAFQDKKGLLAPAATADSINIIIAQLSGQRAAIQAQLASLPKSLNANHPNIMMLKQAMAAIDTQIQNEKEKLAAPSGNNLNYTVDEFQRLQLDVEFAKELYKTSMMALEKVQLDAIRLLDKVSILQEPTLPDYPMAPRRLYNIVVTLLFAVLLAGILKLLESIMRDHID